MKTRTTRVPSLRTPRSEPQTPRSLLPLHHRIYIVLRGRLVEGLYRADQPMPGEHQLAEDFAASRVTIRRVLARLNKEKLIDRRHGAGTFPMPMAGADAVAPSTSYYDYIAASSHAHDVTQLEFAMLETPAFLAQIDGRFGPTALKIVRIAVLDGTAHHLLRTYVPGDFAKYISRRTMGNKTVLELLKKHGISPRESEIQLGAIAADTFEARHLEVPVGVPLVHAVRLSRLADGRMIEYNQMLSVGGIVGYRFSFDWRNGTVKLPPLK